MEVGEGEGRGVQQLWGVGASRDWHHGYGHCSGMETRRRGWVGQVGGRGDCPTSATDKRGKIRVQNSPGFIREGQSTVEGRQIADRAGPAPLASCSLARSSLVASCSRAAG